MRRLALALTMLVMTTMGACSRDVIARSDQPAADAAPPPDKTATPAVSERTAATPEPLKAEGSTGTTPAEGPAETARAYREVTLPAGTVLPVTLETAVASNTSHVEQAVRGRLRRAVTAGGIQAFPAGTIVTGHVTSAVRPGRVKGRGYVAVRFDSIDIPNQGADHISTSPVGHYARATKEKDTLKVVAPAAGAAVLGRIVGGKSGARKGAVIGGAAGTGYVLGTRGEEAQLNHGEVLSVRLTKPLKVRVPVRR